MSTESLSQAIDEIIRAWRDQTPEARAISRLTCFSSDKNDAKSSVMDEFIRFLSNQDSSVRANALERPGEEFRAAAAPAILELGSLLLSSEGYVIQRVLETLKEIGGASKAYVPDLMSLLDDPRPDARCGVAMALGGCEQAAVPALPKLIALLREQDQRVRIFVVKALGAMKEVAGPAVHDLIALLAEDDWEIRYETVDALMEIGAPAYPAVPHLIAILESLDDDAHINGAALALARIGPRAAPAIPTILSLLRNEEILKSDENEDLPTDLVFALRGIGVVSNEITALLRGLLQAELEKERYGEDCFDLVCAVVETLGDMGQTAAVVPELAEILQNTSNDLLPLEICMMFGKLGAGAASAVPTLVSLIQDTEWWGPLSAEESWKGQEGVVWALGQIGEASAPAVPHLITLLQSRSETLRKLVIYALGNIGEASAVAHLIPFLQSESEEEQTVALNALAKIGRLPMLVMLMRTDSKSVRGLVVREWEGYPKVTAAIVQQITPFLHSRSRNERWRAARALGEIGEASASAVPGLVPLLRDRSFRVRYHAAAALGMMGTAAVPAVPHLIPLLVSDSEKEQRQAAHALGRIGAAAAPAVPYLIPLLRSESKRTRAFAIYALGKIGAAAPAIPHLTLLLQSKFAGEREQAARALAIIRVMAEVFPEPPGLE